VSEAGETRAVEVVTFGCRLNTLDSEAIRRAAPSDLAEDLVVLNTCAVTGEAVRQARQTIRRIARERPQARIVVTGCAAQTEPETFADMPEVFQVLGNGLKADPAAWASFSEPDTLRVRVPEPGTEGPLAAYGATADGRTRAFVQVQTGCDHRCTFCIIPYGRGPSRSAALGEIVDQVQSLVAEGVREIVLTGVDLTSWGHDLPGTPRLGRLVSGLLKHVPDLPRLRLSSLDCIEIDDALLQAIADEPRLMPHLHLSLQAGDDLTLKRMKRRHLRDDAIRLCAELRRLRPELVFGADFITGFPTETDEMFAGTLDMVEACGLTHLHVFPFSPRRGTPAARMPQVPRDIAKERAARLREAGRQALARHLDAQIGRRLTVLSEQGGQGRAEDFTLVRLPGIAPRQLIDVTVQGHDGSALLIA
jgi:threonylcarbamoyladenosine tRNA methylthiotransferase MtaB